MKNCYLTEKDSPIIYCCDSNGKFQFFHSFSGEYMCTFSPASLINKKFHKGITELSMAIKHLGQQQFLLCIENFLVIITVKIYTYLQKYVAQLVYKFDTTDLYFRKLPKLHGNSFYSIHQNYHDDIVMSNSNGLHLLQQLFDDEIFFEGRKGIHYFNSFENRELL